MDVFAVEFGAFVDPAFEELDLCVGERVVLLGHAFVLVVGDETMEEEAGVGIAGLDGGFFAVAWLEQLVEGVDAVAAFIFVLFVAGQAFVVEDGSEVFAEGDGGGVCCGGEEQEQEWGDEFYHGAVVSTLESGVGLSQLRGCVILLKLLSCCVGCC